MQKQVLFFMSIFFVKFKPTKGSDFVDGEMDYATNTCILTEKGPPSGGPPGGDGGGGGGGPPGGDGGGGGVGPPSGGGRKKRQVEKPSVNINTFDIDWISFFAVQDKPVRKYNMNYQ